jgi:hypothetical protein
VVTNPRIWRRSAALTRMMGGGDSPTEVIRANRGGTGRRSKPLVDASRAAMQICVTALSCLAVGGGCSGGSLDTSAFQPAPAVTLAWDQQDGLAEYYLVKTGTVLVRTEAPSVRLELTAASHVVEISSCNTAGCSEPSSVVLDWRDGRWTLLAAEREDTPTADSQGRAKTSGLSTLPRRQRSGILNGKGTVPEPPSR